MNPQNKKRVLAGKRIVITRARSQAGELARKIEELGGEVIVFPTIEIRPPRDYGPLDEAIRRLGDYDWLFFTSVNGVEHFFARMRECGKSVGDLPAIRIVAIGSETAKRLEIVNLKPSVVPRQFQAEGILEVLRPEEIRSRRILLPRAAKAREVLPETLRSWGGRVDVVEAYRTVTPESDVAAFRELLKEKPADVITFTSSSTVSNFADLFYGEDLPGILGSTLIACIGPITNETVNEMGLKAAIVAKEYTTNGLVREIVEYFHRHEA